MSARELIEQAYRLHSDWDMFVSQSKNEGEIATLVLEAEFFQSVWGEKAEDARSRFVEVLS